MLFKDASQCISYDCRYFDLQFGCRLHVYLLAVRPTYLVSTLMWPHLWSILNYLAEKYPECTCMISRLKSIIKDPENNAYVGSLSNQKRAVTKKPPAWHWLNTQD